MRRPLPLAPIARDFGFPTDWRLPGEIQKALAGRPPLASLGPFCGAPGRRRIGSSRMPPGVEHSLAEFRGRPVLLLFFLGRGCLHCKEQLEAFAKKKAQLSQQGLT